MTHAYLYTGDEKYKRWVLDYTEAWMERAAKNGGVMPDNVGPTGIVGERRNGNFWGGQYGWNHYQGFNIMFHSLNIAAECAVLMTGDFGYLDLLRDQVKVLLDASITREDGQLIMPTRYGPSGWQYDPPLPRREDTIVPMRHVYTGPMPWRMQELTHLYHASMSQEDRELIERVREGEVERDWNDVGETGSEKNSGQTEFARYQYYEGRNPDWPEKILSAEAEWSMQAIDEMRKDGRTAIERLKANAIPANPVLTKGLTQVTMGTPQSIYNGGLLRATVRYYDGDEQRPGLPADVAALVDHLDAGSVGVQLVNCSREHSRRLIVQAGAFGEHTFTEVRTDSGDGRDPGGDGRERPLPRRRPAAGRQGPPRGRPLPVQQRPELRLPLARGGDPHPLPGQSAGERPLRVGVRGALRLRGRQPAPPAEESTRSTFSPRMRAASLSE